MCSYEELFPDNRERIEAYFNERVSKTARCWAWTGAASKKTGYGRANIMIGRYLQVSCSAHILSYLLYKGDVPDGLVVRHSCDDPTCVNPEHLLLGTAKENSQDMVRRGRATKSRAKFSKKQVVKLRKRYADGVSAQVLAEEHGVDVGTIHRIVRGQSYSEYGGPTRDKLPRYRHPKKKRKPKQTRTRTTPEMARAIRADHAAGMRPVDLQEKYDLSRSPVWKILTGRLHPN